MTIYLVVDRPPADFGEFSIIRAFLLRKSAEQYLKEYKAVDSYKRQYVCIEKIKADK